MKQKQKPQRKNSRIIIRITQKMRERIENEAVSAEMSIAEWARHVLLSRLPSGDGADKTG